MIIDITIGKTSKICSASYLKEHLSENAEQYWYGLDTAGPAILVKIDKVSSVGKRISEIVRKGLDLDAYMWTVIPKYMQPDHIINLWKAIDVAFDNGVEHGKYLAKHDIRKALGL